MHGMNIHYVHGKGHKVALRWGRIFSLGRVQYYSSRAEVVTHEIPAQSKRRMLIVKDGTIFVRRSNAYMLAQIFF